jgi:hypothetical protein
VVEILKSLELAAGRFNPPVIVVPGVILTAFGLFIWLDGLRFRRISLGMAVVIFGVLSVFLMGIHSPIMVIMPIAAAVMVVTILPRVFMAVLLAKLVAVIVFFVLAWPFITASQGTAASPPRKVNGNSNLPFSTSETIDLARAYGMDLTDNIKQAGKELPSNKWLIVGAVGLSAFVLGLFFKDVAGALACSLFGTLLIWAGLVILLMFKGSTPVQRIEHDALAYGLGAVGMIAFAGVEQYLLCRRAERRRKARQPKGRLQPQEETPGWRGQ